MEALFFQSSKQENWHTTRSRGHPERDIMPMLNDDTLQDFLGMTMILQPIRSHQQISPMSLSAICHAFDLCDSDLANAAGLSRFQVDEALRGLPVEHQVVRAIVEGLSRLTGYLWLQRDIQW